MAKRLTKRPSNNRQLNHAITEDTEKLGKLGKRNSRKVKQPVATNIEEYTDEDSSSRGGGLKQASTRHSYTNEDLLSAKSGR